MNRTRALPVLGAVMAWAVLLGAGPETGWVTPAAVDLGSAGRYAVLAGGGISDTGPSAISGDVGTYPFPAIADRLDAEVTGRVERAGVRAQQAQHDLAGAIAAVAVLPTSAQLALVDGGALAPGVYGVTSAEQARDLHLTLDGGGAASAVWIFVVADGLATAPGGTVTLVNGAQACNVFWSVTGSVTLASGTTFAGTILATSSVTVGDHVTIAGRLLARTGAVALRGDTVTVPACSSPTAKSATQPVGGAQPPPTAANASMTRPPSSIPGYVPLLMVALLVLAVILGEPRHRHSRPARRGW